MRLAPYTMSILLLMGTGCTGSPADQPGASFGAPVAESSGGASAEANSSVAEHQDPGDPLGALGVSDLIVQASLAPAEHDSGVGQNHTMTVLDVRFSSPLLDTSKLEGYLERDPLRLTTLGSNVDPLEGEFLIALVIVPPDHPRMDTEAWPTGVLHRGEVVDWGPPFATQALQDALGYYEEDVPADVRFIDLVSTAVATENDPALAVTPGALGEWRRDNRVERVEEPPDAADSPSLDEWLATSWRARPLSSRLGEIPAGADVALGVAWTWREMVVESAELLTADYHWIGLRFPQVGLLGPFRVDDGASITNAYGFGPDVGPVELVGWQGPGLPTPEAQPTVLAELDTWPAEGRAWGRLVDEATVELTALDVESYQQRLESAVSGGG